MSTEVVMPQMGESIFEGTITKWLKKAGDKVQRDEHRVERGRLGKIVQVAYAACRDNPNRANLDALEAAQDACFEHDKKSAEHKYQVEHHPETVIGDAKHKESQAEFRAKLVARG